MYANKQLQILPPTPLSMNSANAASNFMNSSQPFYMAPDLNNSVSYYFLFRERLYRPLTLE
jgi:hypothetical protein